MCSGFQAFRTSPKVAHHRTAAVGKLVQILFSQQHRAGSFQAANDFGVFRGDPIFEQRTGSGGADAGGVDQILERERNAVQRAAPVAAPNLGFGLACLRQRGLRGHGNECIQSRIQLLDACQALGRQLDRRDRALAEQFAGLPEWIAASPRSSCQGILSSRREPRGDSRPRLSGRAKLDMFCPAIILRSFGPLDSRERRVPTWFVVFPIRSAREAGDSIAFWERPIIIRLLTIPLSAEV